MRYWLFLWLGFLPVLPALAAPAAVPGMAIAAVVGEEAISTYDVANRIKFIIATARLSGTPEVIERIRPQVMRSLIDEKLQLQEAARNNITISEGDIAEAIAAIEAQRGMAPGSIEKMLAAGGVPRATFIDQVRAQLAWSRLLLKKVRPQIKVSEEEVRLAARRIEIPVAAPIRQELKIAVISLPVTEPARAKEMQRMAEKLVGEIRGGASFEEVSRQFSSSAASAGGKVEAFWVLPEQLDPNVARALAGATPGTITDAVATREGFTVIKVYDTRALGGTEQEKHVEVEFKEILLKLKNDTGDQEANVMLDIGKEVAKHPGSCQEKGVAGIEALEDVDIMVEFRRSLVENLPPALKIMADNLNVGDISTPLASAEGIRLYMLCDKKEVTAPTPDKDRIYAMLMQQKMELGAQKYMRGLYRDTFIDVR